MSDAPSTAPVQAVKANTVGFAWRKEGPPLIAAFDAVTAAGSNAAELEVAYAALAARLLVCLRGGVFRCLQAELPGLFLSTGRPHRTLHELLVRLQPRISAPTANKNAARNNGARALPKANAQAIASAAPAAAPEVAHTSAASADSSAAAAIATNTLPLPASLSSNWFGSLVACTSFLSIGTAHHHSLQVLLLQSVDNLHGQLAGEAERTYAREVLLPQWIHVPCITQYILTVYGLVDISMNEGMESVLYYFRSLQSASHHAEALGFLSHFGSLAIEAAGGGAENGGGEGLIGLLTPLLKRSAPMGWDMVAQELAQDHPLLRETLVRLLTTIAHKSPQSLKCIQKWNMDPLMFPEVTHDLAARQLRWLVREGKAEELGSEVCGGSVKLQKLLVRELLFAGELGLAEASIKEFHLGSEGANKDQELLDDFAQHMADRAAGLTKPPVASGGKAAAAGPFLRLPAHIPIIFVTASDPDSIASAAVGLSSAQTDMVGLDVEFGFTGSSSAQPALLQIATRTCAYLFDLLCFDTCEAMGSILQALFRCEAIRKVGYAWDGDWRILHGGFPQAEAFRTQTNVIDMADPARTMDRMEAIREAKAEAEMQKKNRAEQLRINEEAEANDLAIAAAAAATATTVTIDGVAARNNIGDAADDVAQFDTPSASAEPPMTPSVNAADDDAEEEDQDSLMSTEEPTNIRAVCAAATGVAEPQDGCDASTTAASSSKSASSAAATASPSREERRKAKKVTKKAARSSIAAVAASSASSAAAGGDDDAPVIRKGVAKGLSSLAQMCLGLPLDKHFQVSAWRRRPLKPEQLHYAALDAYCLLGIYDGFFVNPLPQLVELGAVMQPETFVQYTPARPTVAPIPVDSKLAATATASSAL